MSKKNTDNAIDAPIYLLKKNGIKYTEEYLSEQLQTHPFYPSLAAISDVFATYHIESDAYKISFSDLTDVKTPFIAHLNIDNGIFIVIEKVTDSGVFFHYQDSRLKKIQKEDFLNVWDNIIFQIKTSSISEEPGYIKHNRERQIEKFKIPALVSVVSFLFLFFVLTKPSLVFLIPLFLVKISGLLIAILLIKEEMGYQSKIADKLCTMSKSAGCNEVLNSKAAKLLANVSLADVGLVWFITSLLYLCFISFISINAPTLNLLGWLAVCAIPMILFSISYQIFVVKKYCPLCLGVMLMLAVEAVLFFTVYNFRFQLPQISEILLMCALLCIVASAWFELKKLLKKNALLQESEISYLHLKRQPAIIASQLSESSEIDISRFPAPIHLTNNNSNFILTEVINLYCSPCKRTFEKIKHLIENTYEGAIDLQVILLSNYDNPEDIITKTAAHLIALAEQQSVDLVKRALFDWFDLLDYHAWSEKYSATIEEQHFELLKKHAIWFNENKMEGTPVSILNNKIIPYIIDIEDINYIIND